MSAATSDRATPQRPGILGVLLVAATAILFSGTLVCINDDGYAVDGSDGAGLRFAGVTRNARDNSDGTDGALSTEVFREGQFRFASSGLTQADIGQPMYLLDNQTVVLATNTSLVHRIYVGRLMQVVSATDCWVEIQPQELDPSAVAALGFGGLAASTTVAADRLLCWNSSGYLVEAADSSGYRFAGFSTEAADNSLGANGAVTTGFIRSNIVRLTSAALGADDIGKAVYVLNATTVVLSGHASLAEHIYVGRITRVLSATAALVELRPDEEDPNLVTVTADIAGETTGAALNLGTLAGFYGGTGIYVKNVLSMLALVTATGAGATPTRKVITTHYTVASGSITCVGDESANRLVTTLRGVVKQS